MPGGSEKDTGDDQAESPIDELIREILSESRVSMESPARGRASALLETAFASALGDSKTSMLERFLLAEAFGGALAEALAPALAELLAPKLMKYLEQVVTGEPASKGPAARPGRTTGPGPGRKP